MEFNNNAKWFILDLEEVFKILNTKGYGLNTSEAQERLKKFGYNEITFKKPSAVLRFLRQFNNPLIYVLLAAALICILISLLSGEHMWNEVWIILLVVIVNCIIGFIQEGKAESAIEALKKLMVTNCTVIRDGTEKIIPSREVVPGDVVVLNSGDKVVADLRLFEVKNLAIDESSLTGESNPVNKSIDPIDIPDLQPVDQKIWLSAVPLLSEALARE